MSSGRGRLSSIDLMPPEADHIVAWAAQELSALQRTQTEIYTEFVEKCDALMAEHRGELEFDIPSMSSFNRYSMRQAKLTRSMDETKRIVGALSQTFDPKESDDLTTIAAEAIKSLVFHMVAGADADSVTAKDAMQMASALRQAAHGQHISSKRRAEVDRAFQEQAGEAIDKVVAEGGMTAERADFLRREVLGVKAKPAKAEVGQGQ